MFYLSTRLLRYATPAALLLFMPLMDTQSAVIYHDFHSSICQIDYNETEKTLEIAISLFTEDLTYAIEKELGDKLQLETGEQDAFADPAISYYLNQHLQLKLNNKAVDWHWVGKEVLQDQVWCYLSIAHAKQVKRVWVANTVFMELFNDQINWVHLNVKGKKHSVALQQGSQSSSLLLN